jgi:hypothetical protein
MLTQRPTRPAGFLGSGLADLAGAGTRPAPLN